MESHMYVLNGDYLSQPLTRARVLAEATAHCDIGPSSAKLFIYIGNRSYH